MKFLGYGFLTVILPFLILIILLIIWVLPKIKANRKEARELILREGRTLSDEDKRKLKNKFIKEVEAEMDTAGQRELLSELVKGDLKDLFKKEIKK
jgi:hypothetical protein